MKLSFRLLSLVAIAALIFSGCRPDHTAKPIPNYDRTGVHALMSPLRSAPQSFTISAGTYTQIEGARGTVLSFNPNSFKDAWGNPVSSGPVVISLLEMYRPGEMIAHRASTIMNNGSLLISGGQIYITATQNGQELRAGTYGIGFRQPSQSSSPMNLYTGSRASNPDSIVTWGEQFTLVDGTRVDSQRNNAPFFQFDSATSFNWINCDYFLKNSGTVTNITVNMPDDSYNPSVANVWLIFPDINSVTFMPNYNTGPHSYDMSQYYRVPVGMKFHVLLLAKKAGTWYYAEQRNMTSNTSLQLSLSPTKVSLEDVKAKLATF